MSDIKQIISLLSNPTEKDTKLIEKAYNFVTVSHDGHLRKSGEPYLNHLLATARTLAELGMGPVTISAGLLHDAIEDTDIKSEDIEKEFGKEILFLVEGVTKLGHIKYQGSSRHNESLRKLFVAMSQDIRVLIIKLCDRLHNMRTLEHVSKEKQLRIATETLEIYASIAYRLGIKKLQRELEDLSFKYVYQEDFKKVEELSKTKRIEQEIHLDKFLKSLKKELAKNEMTAFHTDYRVKGLYSLFKKLKRKEWNIEKVYDVLALRVVVSTIADCYKVLGIIHSVWRPLPGRIKDYIAFPKTNGYQSIHTTIFTGDGGIVEIQIKTDEMYKESEYGITSHIGYKQKQNGAEQKSSLSLSWIRKLLPIRKSWNEETGQEKSSLNLDDVPGWVKDLVDYQKSAKDDKFLDDIKSDFLDERIFVFTPIGDVIDLPKNSSVIDFAYSIHSDIGEHMSGAKVNGKFVAINTVLHNGDRVEIETKKNAKPTHKWLEHCKTTIARRHISHFIENLKK
ncbi:MAG: bifunctional (p)ppGpp synthetase/guanosine-3',5'-bis(diphosphate) 3'-pyrophosphohydrolase [Candidatus Zambryskibacteria bacterium]|nr:bifunctional (p)ppGpp synthetase/guanosine-3',5'-bis(diphosphate) 3'-pyrophosphohydrolase [Candidatus Zambryskibacteria bacterium]